MHTILGEISLHLQSLESVQENNLKGNFPDSNFILSYLKENTWFIVHRKYMLHGAKTTLLR